MLVTLVSCKVKNGWAWKEGTEEDVNAVKENGGGPRITRGKRTKLKEIEIISWHCMWNG